MMRKHLTRRMWTRISDCREKIKGASVSSHFLVQLSPLMRETRPATRPAGSYQASFKTEGVPPMTLELQCLLCPGKLSFLWSGMGLWWHYRSPRQTVWKQRLAPERGERREGEPMGSP